MSWKILLALIILYFLILVLGGLAFHYLERVNDNEDNGTKVHQAKEKLKELLMINPCPDEHDLEHIIREVLHLYDRDNFTLSNSSASSRLIWDIPNSMFFAATLATTIGYGNMAPVTQMGRAFCVFYAFFSIPVCLVMLGGVGHSITQHFNRLDKKMDKCRNPKAEKITKSLRSLTTLIIGMGLFMFLPAGAFMHMEDWSYPDSLYYVFITLTTVGLGDLVAGTGADNYDQGKTGTSYQLSVALWIIFGLAWLSTVIAMAQDFFQSLVDKVDSVVMEQMTLSTLQEKFLRPSVSGQRSSTEPTNAEDDPHSTTLMAKEDSETNAGSEEKGPDDPASTTNTTEPQMLRPEASDNKVNEEEAASMRTPRIVLSESAPDANNQPVILLNDGAQRVENTSNKNKSMSNNKKPNAKKRSNKVDQYRSNVNIA